MHHKPGVPLHDWMATGKAGSDPRMLFVWYAADFCTDPDFADRSPEERANPSMASWDNPHYLEQQRLRLPAHKYRRLHLNLPGLPEGAPFAADSIFDNIDRGVASRAPVSGVRYSAFVDMSGGSNDDAVLAIGHVDADGRAVVDRLLNQGPPPPFDPNKALDRFVRVCQDYGVTRVVGDRYAGLTFQMQFATQGIRYGACEKSASELYEALEPRLNSHEVVLLDVPLLEQQLLGLVWRGARIDHPSGEHDDHAAAVAGLVDLLLATPVRAGGVLHGKAVW